MSLPFLAKRMQASSDELDAMLAEACAEGLVRIDADEHAGRIARLTDAGTEQAAAWKAERDEQTAELLARLSDEEKETLASLIRKLLGMG